MRRILPGSRTAFPCLPSSTLATSFIPPRHRKEGMSTWSPGDVSQCSTFRIQGYQGYKLTSRISRIQPPVFSIPTESVVKIVSSDCYCVSLFPCEQQDRSGCVWLVVLLHHRKRLTMESIHTSHLSTATHYPFPKPTGHQHWTWKEMVLRYQGDDHCWYNQPLFCCQFPPIHLADLPFQRGNLYLRG